MHCAKRDVKPGDKFNLLTVIAETTADSRRRRLLCKCDCGTVKEIDLHHVVRGNTKSCGCFATRLGKPMESWKIKHGLYGTPEYQSWSAIIQRCCNPKCQAYQSYGGRGVSVCIRWRESFKN